MQDSSIYQPSKTKKKAKLKQQAKQKLNIKKLARDSNLNLDKDYIKYLSYLIDYGYRDHFEIQVPLKKIADSEETVIFSAVLKRDLLKENEDILIKKFSRKSEKTITLFGIVTQHGKDASGSSENDNLSLNSGTENIKAAIQELLSKFTDMEDTFIGRLNNEIIIDPIAVYLEL